MKGLALSCVLFCGLALVLVYAAGNGMGARTPSFSSPLIAPLQTKGQSIVEPEPTVVVERNAVAPDMMKVGSIPAPEVDVRATRSIRSKRPKPKPAPEVEPETAAAKEPIENWVKPEPKPKPKVQPPAPETKPVVEPPKAEEPVYQPRDVTDAGPVTQLDKDREWRRQTLERWKQEAAERQRDGAMTSTRSQVKPGHEPELKGTPAEGLFPADGHDKGAKKKKDKKKHHRFLFIRW